MKDIRFAFNEDVKNYDDLRPRYVRALFSDILQYSGAVPGTSALEVGIGTGQATEPFLQIGYDVTAVELGGELAAYAEQRFVRYPNLKVICCAFEEYECPDETYDLLYSATAFHWIPSEIAYPKARTLLKKGGSIALFWNKPYAARGDDPLHVKVQSLYAKYRPGAAPPPENDPSRYEGNIALLRKHDFDDVQMKLYKNTRVFSADRYIALLNTYSDHRSLEPSQKQAFERELREAILSFGDEMKIYDTMDLYLARK